MVSDKIWSIRTIERFNYMCILFPKVQKLLFETKRLTVLSTSLGKMLFVLRFVLNENILF